jgi:hypothetical protein
MRPFGALAAVNHPRPIVAGNPNVEMSQISQLSMDSSLRTNSQSSNFVDVPLGQPSASMGSYSNSHSRSSASSADEQLRRCCYLNEGQSSSYFPNDSKRTTMCGHKSLRGVIRKAHSALLGGPIKSSLRAKKKEKLKKTRFAGIGDTRGVVGRNTMSQGSYNISSSLSSSRSCGSQCTARSGCRVQVQHPATTISTEYGQVVSHLGSSPYHPQRRHQHQHMEASNNCHQDFEERLDHSCRGSEHLRVLRSSDSRDRSGGKKQQRSPSIALLDPVFAKTATPRKKLDIPYPPLHFQPQRRHPLRIQRQEQLQVYESGIDTKNATLKPGIETERGCCDEEEMCTPPNNKVENDSAGRTSNINGDDKRDANPQEIKNDEEQTLSHDSVSGPGVVRDPFSTYGGASGANDSENFSSEQTVRKRRTSSTSNTVPLNSEEKIQQERQSKVSEPENFDARAKEDMKEFKTRLQKLMCDMECEAKATFQKVALTISSATESKLEQKAKTIQEAMKSELGENLDLLDQKEGDAKKAIENLLESKTKKLKEIASASVEKLEVCTESGLTKLLNFTETWLRDSCNTIANRLKPYLFSSSETGITKHKDSNIVSGRVTDVQQSRNERHSVVASTDNDRLKIKSSIQLGPSPNKYSVENSSTSIEGEVSITQGSESRVSQRIRVDKVSVRPLRRSKRTRMCSYMKGSINIDKKHAPFANMTTPTNDKKRSRESLPDFSHGKEKPMKNSGGILLLTVTNNDQALCVTPTAGNSQSLKKTTINFNKECKIETNESDNLQSKRRKRRKTRRSPLTSKRSKTQCDSSRGSVPSEVVAFDDVHLSPLEYPDMLPFAKFKRHPNDTVSGATRATFASKHSQSLGKKRRNVVSRTYKKREKIFDVTDNNIFNF